MIFEYKNGCYNTQMLFKKNTITAICDTGASNSVLDIYSLSKLMNVDAKDIYKEAALWINRGMNYRSAKTAGGKIDRVISVRLKNVKIDDILFEEFYMGLNVDNKLWETNGKINQDNGSQITIASSVLIGLDIIRSGTIAGNSKEIKLENFSMEQYYKICRNKYIDTLNLYIVMEVHKKKLSQ